MGGRRLGAHRDLPRWRRYSRIPRGSAISGVSRTGIAQQGSCGERSHDRAEPGTAVAMARCPHPWLTGFPTRCDATNSWIGWRDVSAEPVSWPNAPAARAGPGAGSTSSSSQEKLAPDRVPVSASFVSVHRRSRQEVRALCGAGSRNTAARRAPAAGTIGARYSGCWWVLLWRAGLAFRFRHLGDWAETQELPQRGSGWNALK